MSYTLHKIAKKDGSASRLVNTLMLPCSAESTPSVELTVNLHVDPGSATMSVQFHVIRIDFRYRSDVQSVGIRFFRITGGIGFS